MSKSYKKFTIKIHFCKKNVIFKSHVLVLRIIFIIINLYEDYLVEDSVNAGVPSILYTSSKFNNNYVSKNTRRPSKPLRLNTNVPSRVLKRVSEDLWGTGVTICCCTSPKSKPRCWKAGDMTTCKEENQKSIFAQDFSVTGQRPRGRLADGYAGWTLDLTCDR